MDGYYFWGVDKPYNDYSDPYGDWLDEMEAMFDYYERGYDLDRTDYFYTTY